MADPDPVEALKKLTEAMYRLVDVVDRLVDEVDRLVEVVEKMSVWDPNAQSAGGCSRTLEESRTVIGRETCRTKLLQPALV